MKKSRIFLLALGVISLASCQNGNNSNSTATEKTTTTASDSSETEDGNLEKAIDRLKFAFQGKINYQASVYASSFDRTIDTVAKEVILYSKVGESVYGERALSYRADGTLRDSKEPFSYYYQDEDNHFYEETNSYDNKVIADYRVSESNYFESIFYNPFEMLSKDDFTGNIDDEYYLPEGFSRQVASWFGSTIENYTDRELISSSLKLNGDKFESMDFEYMERSSAATGSTEVLKFEITFVATGEDVEYTHTQPLADDGKDRSTLTAAFAKLASSTYTMEYELVPDEYRMANPIHEIYYYDGTNIFIDSISEGSVKGFNTGDILLKAKDDKTMQAYTYTNALKFEESSYYLSGLTAAEYLPKFSTISPCFFTPNADGTYSVDELYLRSVWCEIQPTLQNATLKAECNYVVDGKVTEESGTFYYSSVLFNAYSIDVEIVNGLPKFTLVFLVDMMGFGALETVTIEYSDVGTTALPDDVTNKMPA